MRLSLRLIEPAQHTTAPVIGQRQEVARARAREGTDTAPTIFGRGASPALTRAAGTYFMPRRRGLTVLGRGQPP